MRRTDENPMDPEIAAQLDAIDATLAGEPVDPMHAELAELALLLTAGRPSIDHAFAAGLDQRVQQRFAALPAAGDSGGEPPRASRWRWHGSLLGPLAGLSTAAIAAIVAVVVLSSGGGGSSSGPQRPAVRELANPIASSRPGSTQASTSTASTASPKPSAGSVTGAAVSAASSASTSAVNVPTFVPAARASEGSPRPVPNGRKIVQSAQLSLSTPSDRIDAVSQELYDVVGRENGYVNNSNVTAGSGGYAQFQLSVPSSALQATMTALSQLRYASVASRTDAVQDVNGQYLSDQRQLADARALRTSLLRQLGGATTQEQIDSLKARLRDAEASIRSDESTLRGLTHKIDYSQVTVSLNSAAVRVTHHHSGGFTIGKAAHDAGRVLTVAAGVALITLAVLVPVGLVGALAWWIAAAARRRRREQALDLA